MIGHSLRALGLTSGEEGAYRALLAVPDSDVTELAASLGTSQSAATGALRTLTQRGLARMVTDERFAAVAPDASLISMLSEQLEALRTGYAAFGELEQVYRDVQARHGVVAGVETVRGAAAMRSRIGQLQDHARHEVCKFVRPPLVTDGDTHASCDAAVRRGVRYRLVYEKAMLDDPTAMATVRRAADQGKQVRFAATLPVKLMLVDGRTALISEADQPVALVTEHPSLVRLASGLFEQVWPTAVPAAGGVSAGDVAGESGLADPDDRLLLSLLLAGLTDQAIAVRLGVGLRTVQRRVRDLMDAAGVDTRIQLGWQASRKGWVA
ncbi:sugar-specific transcriptional regulator TrmB [Stackebrandtia albiflava]|uniref:Sugar-specific transcriptional regulator TrmB n=1 Tax=Stackebrandtia albiflava TaxID=406432 RepID=A0A562V4D2_9ACTN|nr:helix-turn-helix domain-containing protein [Stackebrandtia albiflava]TWJ12751.1 sugar-specific transcriptional regulator TrmB [Stackebrandtia albiflava]